MQKLLPLLLCCLLLTACTKTTQQTLVTQSMPAYSLAQADELPKTLRIPLVNDRGYLFTNASVNGRRAGAMLFDTGSTLNIIDRGVVARLGLPKTGQGRTVGIAGTETFTQHAVESLAIGELDLGVSDAASLSMQKFMRGRSPAGLIGSVSLLPHPFTIDYQTSELIVYNRKAFVPPKDAEKVALTFYGRLPAITATLANGQDVILIIDTGADNTVSLPMSLSKMPGVLATGSTGAGSASGVGGNIQTIRGWLKELKVFGFRLGGVPVTFEPKTREPRRKDLPVGRIGGQLLKDFRLTFDARYNALWVEFVGAEEE
ncbi:MAG: retropepsin-like domain-containing protein [Phycisphaeraceae bacterium]|nr:retropepsin-like domain-containing protein [Phycisphaeraceae bacterium]